MTNTLSTFIYFIALACPAQPISISNTLSCIFSNFTYNSTPKTTTQPTTYTHTLNSFAVCSICFFFAFLWTTTNLNQLIAQSAAPGEGESREFPDAFSCAPVIGFFWLTPHN